MKAFRFALFGELTVKQAREDDLKEQIAEVVALPAIAASARLEAAHGRTLNIDAAQVMPACWHQVSRGTCSRIRAFRPHRRFWFWLLVALLSAHAHVASAEPPVMAHRPWLPSVGGLCDSGQHLCTRIDEIAFNARVDGILSTSTDRRGFAFAAPYGFSFAIGERLEGGISTSTTVWRQTINSNDETLWYQAPLRFWAKGVLWPWRKDPHQHFAVVASFEQEARLWRFDGPNQLGLLTDLAAFRIAANKPLGLVELGFQLGALWDWQGRYGTVEFGPRVGFHLPFLPETKVFAEFLARNVTAYVRPDILLPGAIDAANPLAKSAVLSFGLVTRPRRQVDFAMVASVGFGDVAPFMLTLRGPLDFSIGKGYPYPQSLVVDILREAGQWIAEQVRKLPQPMRETCVLFGKNGQPIATLGELTADGEACEFQGQRFRLGAQMYPDPAHRRVCLDSTGVRCVEVRANEATNSAAPIAPSDAPTSAQPGERSNLGSGPPSGRIDPAYLRKLLDQGALGPIRGQLDDQCILNEGDQQVSPIGHRSADGKHCVIERDVVNKKTGKKVRTETQQIPVGQSVYRDPKSGRVCLKPNAKGNQNCPVALDPSQNRPLTPGERAGYHGAIGLGKKIDQYVDTAKKGAELLTDSAKLSTTAHEAEERAEQAAKDAVATLKDPHRAKEAASNAWNGTVETVQGAWQAAKNWWGKPTEKKLDDMAEKGGGALLDIPVAAGTSIVTGGTGRLLGAGVDAAEDAAKAGRIGKRLDDAADAVADATEGVAVRAEKGAYSHLPAPRNVEPGRVTTPAQRRRILEANRQNNGGALVSDETGQQLVPPTPSRKGTVHAPNEAHIDHKQPRSLGGSNANDNLQVLSREENLRKGNKPP